MTCPNYVAYAYSGSDGYYIVDHLPAGKYAAWTYNDSIFLDMFWNNKWTWATIDTVVVVSNDTTDSINFKLPVGGKITGKVTTLGASSFATVTAYDTLSYNDYEENIYIDFDSASYEIKLLPTGIYKVYTTTYDSFAPEYYNNKPDWASADPVRVKEDSITSHIDFTLSIGGKITGKVKLPGADSVLAAVQATDTTAWDYYSYYGSAFNPSGDSATYEIVGLPTGTYKVNTYGNSQGYLDEYYYGQPDWESADPIRVKEDSITSNINFTLALGGKITGTVKLPGASSVSATLSVIDTTTGYPYWWGDASNPSGDSATYEVVGLPTGTYKVYAHNEQGYFDEYYNDKPDYVSADTIHVTAGSIRPNIDFTLTLGGIIKGNVSSSSKGSLKDVKVYVLTTPTLYQKYGSTNSSGDYRIAGLQSRYYKILAYGDTIYAPKYYDNDTSWSSADSVWVPESDSVLGKNFTLEVGGSIIGHVYGDGAAPLSGATVTVFGHFDQYPLTRSKTTPADGSYKIGGLPTGYYRVQAYDGCKDIYYNNKTSWSTADSVFVHMPDSVINIDFNFPTTAVEDENDQTTPRPTEFELSQNYPNPFNPETRIEYALKKTGHVTLYIYNILGEKVKTLLDQDQHAGFYQINWDGKNDDGKSVSSGLYFYKLEVNGFSEAKTMLLLK